VDTLKDISQSVGAALKKQGLTLALAESCTGGMVASAITELPGSSAWFERGFITYSNAAKIEMLAVDRNTLEQHGAVSKKVAEAMALGALANSNADIAGSITGIAGPSGGSKAKPVGFVCFAWLLKNQQPHSASHHFDGDRQSVRHQASAFLLQRLLTAINT